MDLKDIPTITLREIQILQDHGIHSAEALSKCDVDNLQKVLEKERHILSPQRLMVSKIKQRR